MKQIVILYHKACADGFGAAVAAWMAFGDTAEYIPVQYGDDVPHQALEAETVYILDFSFPRETLIALAERRRVIVLDHHETAEVALAGLELPNNGVVKFSKTESGAVMAWAFLWLDTTLHVPELLHYVQDRDLWEWCMPHSREVSAALQHVGFDFEKWAQMITHWQESKPRLIEVGAILLESQRRRVRGLCRHPRVMMWGLDNVVCVNSPLEQSEIGECLLLMYPTAAFACIYFQKEGGDWVYSLRSRAGQVNVAQIAKNNGGGGHACAAGFTSKTLILAF